jgi:hypothetical protein
MKISDLIGARVVCSNGASVGKVHDVRLVREGQSRGDFGATYRVEGLLIGAIGIGARLGYNRPSLGGPMFVGTLVRRIRSGARHVDWADVSAVSEGEIHLSMTDTDFRSGA